MAKAGIALTGHASRLELWSIITENLASDRHSMLVELHLLTVACYILKHIDYFTAIGPLLSCLRTGWQILGVLPSRPVEMLEDFMTMRFTYIPIADVGWFASKNDAAWARHETNTYDNHER